MSASQEQVRRMTTGAVRGSVRLWLRLEGLVVLGRARCSPPDPHSSGRLYGQHTLASTAPWATVSNTRLPLQTPILGELEG
jgi:hypothetical protein